MENRLKGAFYIGMGIFVALMSFDVLLKLGFLVLGLYLIYRGLELRSAHQVLFYVRRFKDRF
jgi:hypothetical protein